MESQLSNALGLVENYQKLAFLWHFEKFLSPLVVAARTRVFTLPLQNEKIQNEAGLAEGAKRSRSRMTSLGIG